MLVNRLLFTGHRETRTNIRARLTFIIQAGSVQAGGVLVMYAAIGPSVDVTTVTPLPFAGHVFLEGVHATVDSVVVGVGVRGRAVAHPCQSPCKQER